MHRGQWISRLTLVFGVLFSLPSFSEGKIFSFSRAELTEAYRQGDFEKITTTLRPILTPGNAVSRIDSLFAYRLLGVVYAADPKTRETGRHCFLKLLDLDAKANLVDLFVGTELDQLWEKTRLEHQVRQRLKQTAVRDTDWLTPEDAEALQRLFDAGEDAEDANLVLTPNSTPALPLETQPATTGFPFGNAVVEDERPYWKRPGTWIAAAFAAGVVGYTVYYNLGDAPQDDAKLYHVSKETASSR